jgi:hypothetical protein
MPQCYRVQINSRGEIVAIYEVLLDEDWREIGTAEVDLHDPAMASTIKAIAYVNNKAKIAI